MHSVPHRIDYARRRRRALTALAVVVTAVVLTLVEGGGGGSAGRSTRLLDPGPVNGTPSSTQVTPASTTTTTRPAPTTTRPPRYGPPYAFASTTLNVVDALGRSLPTVVLYPAQVAGGAPATTSGPFPLIVFSQGFATTPEEYSTLLQYWTAAGYVVAAPAYPLTGPGVAFDSDIVNHPADLKTVITDVLAASTQDGSALSGLINPGEVGVIGHSDGGDVTYAVAANTVWHDPRVKAAIVLSGAELTAFGGTYTAGDTPLMVVQGTADLTPQGNPVSCSEQVYDSAPPPKYYLSLLGAGHEAPYMDPGTDQSVVERATVDFLNGYLKHSTAAVNAIAGAASVAGVTTLTTAPTVPLTGSCPGAPPG